MARKIPKNFKLKEYHISKYDLEGPVETLSERLIKLTEGIDSPELEVAWDGWGWGGGDGDDWFVTGFLSMTEKEIVQAERRSVKAKAARVAKIERDRAAQETADRKELARLAAKYANPEPHDLSEV